MPKSRRRSESTPDVPEPPPSPAAAPEGGAPHPFLRATPAQRGALIAVAASAVVLITMAASRARLGFGWFGDIAVGVVALVVLAGLYTVSTRVVAAFARRASALPPAAVVGLLLATAVVLSSLVGIWAVRPLALVALVVVALWGATVAEAVTGWRAPLGRRRAARMAAIASGASALAVLLLWLAPRAPVDRPVALRDAGEYLADAPGPFRVEVFRYGSGADLRRAAYRDSVAFRTTAVDLSPFRRQFGGWREAVHREYWGFTMQEAPRNATVWMPRTDVPVPVVFVAAGVSTDELAEDGFAYLGERLASRGIAVVAVDVNFLNGPWVTGDHARVGARAWMLLEHAALLRELARTDSVSFVSRLDFTRVALMGHSRGGEAAAAAARLATLRRHPDIDGLGLEEPLDVRAVVALSPTDGVYRPADQLVRLEDVSYLLVQGTRDADVPLSAGDGQYDRVRFTPGSGHLKAMVRVHGANHAQFNSRAGAADHDPPLSWLLRRDGILPAERQRAVTLASVVSFLEATLHTDSRARERFEDLDAAVGAPLGVPLTARVHDARTRVLADFEEDVDPTSATLPGATLVGESLAQWREERAREDANGVARVAWTRPPPGAASPSLTLTLPEAGPGFPIGPRAHLVFALSAISPGPGLDFSVELVDEAGIVARVPFSALGALAAEEEGAIWRSPILEATMLLPASPALRTFDVALGAFSRVEPRFRSASLRQIRFRFDRSPEGELVIDDIGLRPAAPR